MAKINIKILVDGYTDEVFDAAKVKFSELSKKIPQMKNYKLLKVLLKIISEKEHMKLITRKQLAEILNSVFYDELDTDKVVTSFMNDVNSEITDAKGNYNTTGRAKKYTDFLKTNFLDKANDKKHPYNEMSDEDILTTLVDYIKIVLAVYQEMSKTEKNNAPIEKLDFSIKPECVKKFENELFTKASFADRANNEHAKGLFKQNPEKADAKEAYLEKNVFNSCILWLLYLRICEEDGIELGEDK